MFLKQVITLPGRSDVSPAATTKCWLKLLYFVLHSSASRLSRWRHRVMNARQRFLRVGLMTTDRHKTACYLYCRLIQEAFAPQSWRRSPLYWREPQETLCIVDSNMKQWGQMASLYFGVSISCQNNNCRLFLTLWRRNYFFFNFSTPCI